MKLVKRKDAKGLDAIFAKQGQTDLDKITEAFDYVTRTIIEQSDKDIELNRALGDSDAVIREQIKKSTLIHARSVLNLCHQRVTGKEIYNDNAK